jgi:hypothetical protein
MGKPRKTDDSQHEIAASSKLVLSLINASNETKTRVQSEAGALGERIKDAVENKHLHASALKFTARLARMDAVKGNEFWRSVQLYMDYASEAGLFGAQSDFIDLAQEAAEAGNGEDIGAENAGKIRRGIKPLHEASSDAPSA